MCDVENFLKYKDVVKKVLEIANKRQLQFLWIWRTLTEQQRKYVLMISRKYIYDSYKVDHVHLPLGARD